ncbi:hypothetical protein [Roseateles violae]|uniref:Uncharacterized protein n=1 Tax=Roseateles violae TaxID=3058042 RepID=A0ABT8DYG2_9BURK|nr:hypothetical protein [Pelomonas sp. PFR6]MDN3922516.1 hypothetical protein [Pelomonas sp. PFR6]
MSGNQELGQQFNLGQGQKVAMRDYVEVAMPQPLDLLLATTPDSELDVWCTERGRLFRARFGFDAPQPARAEIVEIRKAYGFTDLQIKQLFKAGVLRVRGLTATLKPSVSVLWIGYVQITCFAVWTAMWCALVLSQPGFDGRHMAAISVYLACFFLAGYPAYLSMIRPNRIVHVHRAQTTGQTGAQTS